MTGLGRRLLEMVRAMETCYGTDRRYTLCVRGPIMASAARAALVDAGLAHRVTVDEHPKITPAILTITPEL